MRSLLKSAFGLAYFIAVFGVMLMAVAAAFGFIHPSLDSFNHLQPLIFTCALLGLVLTPFMLQHARWQTFIVCVCATGFVASSIIVIPEAVEAWRPKENLPEDGRPIYKLMTHNVFGQNWELDKVLAGIKAENPDILTFQEYFPYQRKGIHEALVRDYPFFVFCSGGKRENIAIYAKLPFQAEKSGSCAPGAEKRVSRVFGFFDGTDGVGFTIATTHLDWPAQLSKFKERTNLWDGLDAAVARQRGQFDQLANALSEISGPLMLTADFNSTSWSYALRGFEHRAGLTRQDRMLLTYPMRYYFDRWRDTVPFLPLDHVMTRGGIAVHAIYAGDAAGSDHRPLITLFSVNR